MIVHATTDYTRKRTAYYLEETPNYLSNEGNVVGRVFMTQHPTIPLEVFAYRSTTRENNDPWVIGCKRVHTVKEAISWRESFLPPPFLF